MIQIHSQICTKRLKCTIIESHIFWCSTKRHLPQEIMGPLAMNSISYTTHIPKGWNDTKLEKESGHWSNQDQQSDEKNRQQPENSGAYFLEIRLSKIMVMLWDANITFMSQSWWPNDVLHSRTGWISWKSLSS